MSTLALPLVTLPGLDASLSFTRPLVLAGLPVAALLVFLLVRRSGGDSESRGDTGGGDGDAAASGDRTASRRARGGRGRDRRRSRRDHRGRPERHDAGR